MRRRNYLNLYIVILITFGLIFSILTISVSSTTKKETLGISAKAAVLYQPDTDRFLFKKNEKMRLPMASTTKIMTALVAIENAELEEIVKIAPEAIGTEGSSAYLKNGDILTMEELLYALLLQSANDAAVALAYYIGGDISGFADLMNKKAEELGLLDTHFTNPHGLDDEEHFTTASDLAVISAAALKNETFKTICSTYKKHFSTEKRVRNYVNHNKLLSKYWGCIGVKTGYTKKSGRCLVGAAEKDGLTFITVTLDAPNDWSDHETMLDLGFEVLERISLASPNEYCYKIPVIGGTKEYIIAQNADEASYITERNEKNISYNVKLSKFVTAPINKGDILGEVIFSCNGDEITSVKIIANETITKDNKKNFFQRLFGKYK